MATIILYPRTPEAPVLHPFFPQAVQREWYCLFGFSGQWFVHQYTVMH